MVLTMRNLDQYGIWSTRAWALGGFVFAVVVIAMALISGVELYWTTMAIVLILGPLGAFQQAVWHNRMVRRHEKKRQEPR